MPPISPSAVASPWVREELRYALAAEEKGLRVIPVILRAAPILTSSPIMSRSTPRVASVTTPP